MLEARNLDDMYSGIYEDGKLLRVNVETTDADFFIDKINVLIAERDRLAAENAELRKKDGAGLIAEAERLMCELAAANAAHAQLVIDYEQVLADLEASGEALEKLREVGIDPGYHGNPADWAVEDRLDTLIQFQAILYPPETTDDNG